MSETKSKQAEEKRKKRTNSTTTRKTANQIAETKDFEGELETLTNTFQTNQRTIKRKLLIKDNILELMEERRKQKTNKNDYNKMDIEIKTELQKAKDEQIKGKCEEMDQLQK